MEFMKPSRDNNAMEALSKFYLKKSKEQTIASFYSVYGFAKRPNTESSQQFGQLEPAKNVEQFMKSGYSFNEVSKISKIDNVDMEYGDNVTQSLFSGEKGYQDIKRVAIARLKGRALSACIKSGNPNMQKYFLRWMVHSNKRHGARCIENLILKSRITLQVGFYRCKELYRPAKMYKKKVNLLVTAVEKKLFSSENAAGTQSFIDLGFENIKRAAEINYEKNKQKTFSQFSDILDGVLQEGLNRIVKNNHTQNTSSAVGIFKQKRI